MWKRLQAELSGLGFVVVELTAVEEAPSPDALADAARREGALAAIRIVTAGRSVTVWIADLATGKTVSRTLAAPQQDVNGEVVALQAVELLRASLMELTLWRTPIAIPAATATDALQPETPPSTVRWRMRLSAAPAVLLDRGTGVAAHVALGARSPIYGPLGLSAMAFVPLVPATVREAEGEAEVSTTLVGLGLDWDIVPDASSLSFRAGAGGALTHVRGKGTAQGAYAPRTESVDAASLYAGATGGYRLSSRLEISLSILAGLSTPRPVIYFAEHRIAPWGQPFAAAALGVQVGIP
jgi:hypothetical protein